MRIVPIFFGGYYLQPTPGSGAEKRPRRRLDTAPRRPPSDPIPRRICQPHELLRAQRTPPQPPDFGGDVPSCPAGAAAHPPWTPCQPGPARERHFFLNPPLACSAVQPGVFRGSELRIRLTIIPVMVSLTLHAALALWVGNARRDSVATARESLHFPVLPACGQRRPPSRRAPALETSAEPPP